MTGMMGILLATVAGSLVSSGRWVAFAVALPLLLVCGVQTWGLAAGLGVNPASTVSDPAYWVVQVIVLLLAVLVADQIRRFRLARRRGPGVGAFEMPRSRVTRALVINLVAAAVAVVADELATISVARQSGEGLPPVYGVIGIALLPLTALVLGVLNLVGWRLRVARRSAGSAIADGRGSAAPATVVAAMHSEDH